VSVGTRIPTFRGSVVSSYSCVEISSVLYTFFWVIPRRLKFICRRFGTLFHLHRQVNSRTYLPMKMEQTECSETSAYKFQTPGNRPKESIQHSVHGESLKSRSSVIFKFRPLKMRTLNCYDASGSDYQVTQRHIPEERSSQLQCCENLTIREVSTCRWRKLQYNARSLRLCKCVIIVYAVRHQWQVL